MGGAGHAGEKSNARDRRSGIVPNCRQIAGQALDRGVANRCINQVPPSRYTRQTSSCRSALRPICGEKHRPSSAVVTTSGGPIGPWFHLNSEPRQPELASALGCEIQIVRGRDRKWLAGHGFGIGVLKEAAFSFHHLVCVDRYVLRNNRLRANGFEMLDFMRSR
jgi:hypothetical protein